MKIYKNKYIAVFIFLSFILNCSTNTPEIKDSFVQVNLFEDRESNMVYQKLSVFIIPFDGDGFEDLSIFYIINDNLELFWAVTSEEWISGNKNGNKWVGTNSLIMPDLKDFPQGEFRIVLEDLSGESVEKPVYLSYRETDKNTYSFPYIIDTDDDRIYIKSPVAETMVWLYENGAYINNLSIENNIINKRNIFPETDSFNRSFYIYYFEQEFNIGIITGPYFNF